ncbi:MAG TPA: YcaO-like family protein [Rhodopila sp.]|uniref:YcaO-like family protein n=1 Tax=Rhodopila sp. TaxID=2480087 RepID=UPI002CC8A75B|nr:YcaO-like family protein [Rhodopila sp.]HVY15280.1 YcaO-like family protein [Rhodopila sp.]
MQEQILEECARVLIEGQAFARQSETIQSLLRALEFDEADVADKHNRAKLLQAASGFARLFQLRSPDAPGLTFFGAQADPGDIAPGGTGQPRFSSSGVGLTFRAAFEGCVGEAVELLSQVECGEDGGQEEIGAQNLLDGARTSFPASLCLRRGAGQPAPPWPLSIGCSAGTSHEAATLRALLELIERDAAALWWRGGVRAHAVPMDSEAARRVTSLLGSARGAGQRRQCWVLDISSDLGVPCVVAVSVGQQGGDFACGVAARLSLARAADAAVLEMCQAELAHHVVAAKRLESGDGALNAHDLAHLRRRHELPVEDCLLLHPLPPRVDNLFNTDASDVATALRVLLEHLKSHGIDAFAIDLTRKRFGIPVVRVLCPTLEKEPSQLVGDRLRTAIERTGGGDVFTHGIPLM